MNARTTWTFAISSIALSMVTLDNIVEPTALPFSLTILVAAVLAEKRGVALIAKEANR